MAASHVHANHFFGAIAAVAFGANLLTGQGLKSARHEVARPIPVPACTAPRVLCVTDTTRTATIGECCMDYSTALWIVMPSKGDSIEFLALRPNADDRPSLTLSKPGRPGVARQEELPGLTAHFVRHRFELSAPYVLDVAVSPVSPRIGDRFELRVRMIAGDTLSAAMGTVTLVGDKNAWFSFQRVDGDRLTPVSEGESRVRSGTYRLLAKHTDTFRVCKLPCVSPKLISGGLTTPATVR